MNYVSSELYSKKDLILIYFYLQINREMQLTDSSLKTSRHMNALLSYHIVKITYHLSDPNQRLLHFHLYPNFEHTIFHHTLLLFKLSMKR